MVTASMASAGPGRGFELFFQQLEGDGDAEHRFPELAGPRLVLDQLLLAAGELVAQLAEPALQPVPHRLVVVGRRRRRRQPAGYDWIPIHCMYHPMPCAFAGVS